MCLDGFLLIDKPLEWTTFDVVAKVRGVISRGSGKKIKVGHTGTLDPLASGLVIIVIGSYCKRASEFSNLDKTYEVSMKLGEMSSTGDEEGEKTVISSARPELAALQQTLIAFEGESMQTPPMYSAVKVDGKRAYKLAREGKEAKLEPRQITVRGISLIKYDYPYVKFRANVSSGTYIRSLVQDIGENLSTGAYTAELRRTEVGKFKIDQVETDLVNLDLEKIYHALRT